jgi:hypothetical protein
MSELKQGVDFLADEKGEVTHRRGPDGEWHPACAGCKDPIVWGDVYMFGYERTQLGDVARMVHLSHFDTGLDRQSVN